MIFLPPDSSCGVGHNIVPLHHQATHRHFFHLGAKKVSSYYLPGHPCPYSYHPHHLWAVAVSSAPGKVLGLEVEGIFKAPRPIQYLVLEVCLLPSMGCGCLEKESMEDRP